MFKLFNKKQIDEIVILGRGLSRNHYFKNNSFVSVKNVMLINHRKSDLNDKQLSFLINKDIHMIFNICEPILSNDQIKKLNIINAFLMRTKSMRFKKEYKRLKKDANVYGKVKYLPRIMNDYWHLNNTGTIAVAYATVVLKAKKIIIYGFDFYQDMNYYKKFKFMLEREPDIVKAGKEDLSLFLEFLNQNHSIDYFIHSHIQFPKMHNLKIF